MNRHGRQVRLAEVGQAGQARIAAASVEVRLAGLAADAAAAYLVGAGVSQVRVASAEAAAFAGAIDPTVKVGVDERLARDPLPPPQDLPLRDPVARDLAWGSLVALQALRTALDGVA